MTTHCGSTDTTDGTPCKRETPEDREVCVFHGDDGPPAGHGAPPENANAASHELFTDRDIYYQRLDDDRQAWVYDMTHAILDRLRAVQGDADLVDHEIAKNIAIDMDKVATANAHISRQGLMQDIVIEVDGNHAVRENAEQSPILKELRLHNESILSRLQRLGVLEDPLSQNADATQTVAELLSEANPDATEGTHD